MTVALVSPTVNKLYRHTVFRTKRGWVGQIRKRVGDLTFLWWETRPWPSKRQAFRACENAIASGTAVDQESEELGPHSAYQMAWVRMRSRYPLLDREETAEYVIAGLIRCVGGEW